jgi:hypothetical protein
VGGAVAPRRYESEANVAFAVDGKPLVDDRRTRDVGASLFDALPVIRFAVHPGMRAKPSWLAYSFAG